MQPITGLSPEKCQQRNRLSALAGVNTAPLELARKLGPPVTVAGTLPADDDEALAMINARLAEPVFADQVYIRYVESANSNFITSRYMELGESTLRNISRDAARGFAFMNSHRTGAMSTPSELPFGATFAGQYQEFENGWRRSLMGVYMPRGVRPNGANGPTTDDLVKGIDTGTIRDVSMGIAGGYGLCKVCKHRLNSKECGHAPGTTRNMSKDEIALSKAGGSPEGRASYVWEDGNGSEVSAVYDGAVPGAGFLKTLELARAHQLGMRERIQLRSAYPLLLTRGMLGMDALSENEVLDDVSENVASRLFSKLLGGRKLAAIAEEPAEAPLAAPQQAELLRLRRENEELTGASRHELARQFVDNLIEKERRLMPAGRAEAVVSLSQAMKDDAVAPVQLKVERSDGSVVLLSRADAVRAALQNAPKHDLTVDHEVVDGDLLLAASREEEAGDPLEEQGRKDARKFARTATKKLRVVPDA